MISSLNALAVFDPDGENHEEYKKIHKSYKDMVRKLYFFSPTVCSRLLFGNNLETSNILSFFKCLSLVFNLWSRFADVTKQNSVNCSQLIFHDFEMI